MSFAEIKKTINSDLNTPLNTLINTKASQDSVNNVQNTINAQTNTINYLAGGTVFKTLRNHGMQYVNSKTTSYFSGPGLLYSIVQVSLSPKNFYGKIYVNDIFLCDIVINGSDLHWYLPNPIFFTGTNALRLEVQYAGTGSGIFTYAQIFS